MSAGVRRDPGLFADVRRIRQTLIAEGLIGGGRGIRTPGPLAGSAVFKTAPFNRSGIPPRRIRISRSEPAALGGFAVRSGDEAVGKFTETADLRLDENHGVGDEGGLHHPLVVCRQSREENHRDSLKSGR